MHTIEAMIAKAPIDDEVAAAYDLAVFVHEGFAIIALDEDHAAYWAAKLGLDNDAGSDSALVRPFAHYLANAFALERYAIIVTAYAGGMGAQYAAVYEKGIPLMPETEGGINAALKMIGVEARGENDEFDTISLGRYRSFARYYEKYRT